MAERGETYVVTKREVKKACRSVPSQRYHRGDATKQRREKERKERYREKREIERERERWQKEGRHVW